jgi:three-Cys-motif partner protein
LPKPDSDAFFVAPQGAAILKHAVLGRQLKPWASKVGSRAKDKRIAYVDTHAGAGAYEDGSPGSPLLAAQVAHEVAPLPRRLECFYCEPDKIIANRLRDTLKQIEHVCEVFDDPIEQCLDDILARVGDAPMFMFSDPFGLGLSFDAIAGRVMQRSAKTDLMINFSLSALWHCGGQLNNKATTDRAKGARKKILDRLDASLGGDWWQRIWKVNESESQKRDRLIVVEYANRVAKQAGGLIWVAIPVPDRLDGNPAYYLIFFTRHQDGLWLLANNLSMALEKFEEWCARDEPVDEAQQELALDWHGAKNPRELQMNRDIARNVDELLNAQPQIVVGDQLSKVLGEYFGYAREMHIRKALRQLYDDGKISTEPKGDLQRFVVRR